MRDYISYAGHVIDGHFDLYLFFGVFREEPCQHAAWDIIKNFDDITEECLHEYELDKDIFMNIHKSHFHNGYIIELITYG